MRENMKKFLAKNKKASTDVGGLYQLVLVIGLIGIISAVVLVVLANLESSSSVTGTAATAINNSIVALSAIPNTWLSLIVTISVLVVIVVLVIKGFGAMNAGR